MKNQNLNNKQQKSFNRSKLIYTQRKAKKKIRMNIM